MVTAYDAPTARIADEAGVDVILVGDSVAMVVLGYDDTLQVTVDDMARHVAAVARTRPRPLVVADLPWMSYHLSVEDAVRNAAVLVRAGAEAVKLEGGRRAAAGGRGPARRRDPGDGPPRAHPPVGARHGRLPGAGPAGGGGRGPGRRRRGPGRGRLLRHRAGVRPPGGGGGGHPGRAGAHHRHRGRSRLRRPGAGLPRPGRPGGPGAAQVRPPLRVVEGGRGGGGGRLRRPTCGPGGSRPTTRATTCRPTWPPPSGIDAGRGGSGVAAIRTA